MVVDFKLEIGLYVGYISMFSCVCCLLLDAFMLLLYVLPDLSATYTRYKLVISLEKLVKFYVLFYIKI